MKKYLLFSLLLLISALLTGCAFLRAKAIEIPRVELLPGQWIQLPTPAQLKFNVTAAQILTAEYKISNHLHSYTSQVQVEKNSQHLILVTLAGWGGELFSVNYDGVTIKTSSLPMPNLEMGLQHALTDFIFTYADVALIKHMLQTTEIKLVSKPRQRVFMLHNQPVIKIDYQNINPWQGNIVLRNFKYNYTIKIAHHIFWGS